jgi:uncharacterized protein
MSPTPPRAVAALVVLLLTALVVPPAAAQGAPTDLLVSEYVEGTSNTKAIEVWNGSAATVDLAAGGYVLTFHFNGATAAGRTIALTGTVAPGDVHVVAQAMAAPAVLAVADQTDGSGWPNGDDAVVLRRGAAVLDSIGQVGVDPGAEWGTGLTSTADNTLRRKPEDCTGDTTPTDAFDPAIRYLGLATDVVDGLGAHTATCAGGGGGQDPGPPPAPPTTAVSAVQGRGLASEVVGRTVTVEAVVVHDVQNGPAGQQGDLNGFYVQEEDADVDGDPATSEGLFVFDGSRAADPAVDVARGDRVRVTGVVGEFDGQTQLSAVAAGGAVQVLGTAPLPTAAPLTLPLPSAAAPEALEGMRVQAPQPLYVAETFDLDRFGELRLTHVAEGLVTPTQVAEPGSPEQAALAERNQRSQITLDDSRSVQNPSPVPFVDPVLADGTYTDNRRRGDRIDGLVAVLGQAFGRYRLQVDADEVTTADFATTIPRPTGPPQVGGTLRVASANVLNLFTTLDQPGSGCGPLRLACRGAQTPGELERQLAKTATALLALDADVIGLVEVENDADDATVARLVEELEAREGPGTWAHVATGFVGTDAIRQALIYRPAAVTPLGPPAVLDDPAFVNGLSSSPRNRPALAQTFVGPGGGAVTVVVNHLKSKGSGCGPGDDAADGSGSCDGTRTRAVELLLDWLATDPTGTGAQDQLVVGDLNSYAREAPIDRLVAAGWANLLLDRDPDAYGYVFDGQQGTLDYAFAGPSLADEVTGAAELGINAVEADLIDYDLSFRTPGYFNPSTPYRAADHDPLVVGLALEPTAADAGGPYTAEVGRPLQLDGTGSTDGLGAGLAMAWDLDADGAFDDAEGPTPTVERVQGPPGRRTVALRVTDGAGATSVATAVLEVLARGAGNDGAPPGRGR